jgi:hypothetical protein
MNYQQKLIKELSERIEKENNLFNSLSNNEKKVIIAQDCLIRIEAQQIVARNSHFLTNISQYRKTNSMKDYLNNCSIDIPECESCAKGGLFLSLVGRTNEFNTQDLMVSNSVADNEHKKLLEIFTPKELAYIEFAFEGKQYLTEIYEKDEKGNIIESTIEEIVFTDDEESKAKDFFRIYGGVYEEFLINDKIELEPDQENTDQDNIRLRAICNNIIVNNGVFTL